MKCPTCGSSTSRLIGPIPDSILFAGRELSMPMPGGSLHHCQSCGLYFRDPAVDKQLLTSLYSTGSDNHWQWVPSTRVDWRIAREWLERKGKHGGTILDLGCYDGAFLATLPAGWELNGIEANSAAAERATAKGVTIEGSDFGELEHLAAYDVIVAFDVIEHAHNPLEFINNCLNHLAKNGLLIISTGNAAAASWRLLGARHSYATCAEHLSFLSPQWVQWAVSRCNSSVWRIECYCRQPGNIRQELRDVCKNLMYRYAPKIVRELRLRGIARLQHSAMIDHPPTWPTARDHMIFALVKA